MNTHFTATVYILHEGKVLLLPHPKFKKWLPPGGHVEPNETPVACAKREVLEETGLEIELVRQENVWVDFGHAKSLERPYLCLLENIPAYGSIPAHQHIDLIYVARPVGGKLLPEIRWFSLKEAEQLQTDVDIFPDTETVIKHLLSSSDNFQTALAQ